MASEYRRQYPDLAIINDFKSGGWAYVCAGGSMPALPRTTDERLLESIPQMKPWAEASGTSRWVLREPGNQYLVYSSGGASAGLDLSSESGAFQLHTVDPRTGQVAAQAEMVTASKNVVLPKGIVWLTRK